jgi:hypothetical protein
MHWVPSGWVDPDGPQQMLPCGQSPGFWHTIAPESAQSASAAHVVVGRALVLYAQQDCPVAHAGQMPAVPLLLPEPLLLLLLLLPEPLLPEPLELLLPAPLELLLLLPPVEGLFDPHPPVTAAAPAVANPTPSDAKNNTCAFLMRGPYPL